MVPHRWPNESPLGRMYISRLRPHNERLSISDNERVETSVGAFYGASYPLDEVHHIDRSMYLCVDP